MQVSGINISDKFMLRGNKKSGFPTIHRIIPRPGKSGRVDFDIYDYDMLFNDEETKKLIREGKTIGCFYIESPGMRSLLKRLDCDTFEMLTAASSVIRPGVAESGMMHEFIARHRNPGLRKYLIPEMEIYLGETYGVMIYQEDVIKVAHHIVGLTLEEADLLRRAMSGKMRSHKAMKIITDRFFSCCSDKGFTDIIANALWKQIESFAGYAFCKAHSASFALLSYQVAFLKVHYPAEFMASVLSNNGGFYSHAVYIWECRRLGLEVLLPCINNSIYEYTGRDKTVRIGLMAVKNMPVSTINRLISERKKNGFYKSLADFIDRLNPGYEETALLIKCGAFGCFRQTRPELMRLLDIYFRHKSLTEKGDLFEKELVDLIEEVKTTRQYSLAEICGIEFETFGYMITKHPLYFYKEFIKRENPVPASEMYRYDKKKIKMIGWYMTSKRIKTRKGEIMKFLSLEDTSDTFEAVIFPETYRKYAEQTISMGPYFLEGIVDMESGNNLVVEKLEVLSAQNALAATQKDSAENNWFGDKEKVEDYEFEIIQKLDAEKLRQAYVGF